MRQFNRVTFITSLILLSIAFPSLFATFKKQDKGMEIINDYGNDTVHVEGIGFDDVNYSRDIENISYNSRFRQFHYGKINQYTSPLNPNTQLIGYFTISAGLYRVLIFTNGTMIVYNVSEVENYKNYTYWFSQDLDLSDFQVVKGISGLSTYIFISGYNKTNDRLILKTISLDVVNAELDENYNITVNHPVNLTSVSSISIKSMYVSGNDWILVTGHYVNASDMIPMTYEIKFDGSVIYDVIGLNSSDDYLQFDDSIYQGYIHTIHDVFYLVTNSKMIVWKNSTTTILDYEILDEDLTLLARVDFSDHYIDGHTANLDDWASYTTFDSLLSFNPDIFIIEVNTMFNISIRTTNTAFGWSVDVFEPGNIFVSAPDLADDNVVVGLGKNFIKWQQFIANTGVKHGAFDLYYPVSFIKLNDESFEVAFSDSRAMFVSQFSTDLDAYYNISTSNVSLIKNTRFSVEHSKGTSKFNVKISGVIERNDTQTVEIGITPISISSFSSNIFFGISDVYNVSIDLLIRPTQNFIGIGATTMEFFISFETDYCPVVQTFSGVEYVDMNINYVIYEKYSNGNYTQAYMSSADGESVNFLYFFDYELETQIVLTDSYLLDELQVELNGIEYDPFSITFYNAWSNVTIIDTITNNTLFEQDYQFFSDPLQIPVLAKYEANIQYYSNFDKFGFDFSLVNTFLNGTEITTDSIRIVSPDAEIVVKDFSGDVLHNQTYNKIDDGQFIKIGLDVAQIIIRNRYNFTVDFFLSKEGTEIFYQLPADTAIILRLATGTYRYQVVDAEGNELIDKELDIEEASAISIGSTVIEFPSQPTFILGNLTLDSVVWIIVIVVIIGVGFTAFALGIGRTRNPSKKNKNTRSYLGLG